MNSIFSSISDVREPPLFRPYPKPPFPEQRRPWPGLASMMSLSTIIRMNRLTQTKSSR